MANPRRQTITQAVLLLICLALFFGAAAGGFLLVRDMQTQTRGVSAAGGGSPAQSGASGPAIGVNVSLDQYTDDQLAKAFALIRGEHFTTIRQHFYWNEIEPQPGQFEWDKWDRIVQGAAQSQLQVTAVLDSTPEWARDAGAEDTADAPPRDVNDYARFVSALVTRYRQQIRSVEIWDNPNIHPFWGRRNADPIDYTRLLKAAAIAARAANPAIQIVAAGLAPNGELIRGHPDYSDVLFLRGMYEAGARDYMDVVAAKPYGMWSGPDDRRVAADVFNFSRAILLREEMTAQGDGNKPLWAVEFGWNALPAGWQGPPSPWGSDTASVQSARLAGAIERARSEWGWMGALYIQTLRPNAPAGDPVWGFALFDQNFQPTPLAAAAAQAILAPVQPPAFNFVRFYALAAALAFVAAIAGWRGAVAASRLPWPEGWRALQSRVAAWPEPARLALLALAALALYYSPNVGLSIALLLALVLLFSFCLELGLAIAVFTIPFYLLPKTLFGSEQFSMVELLTLVSVAAWAICKVASQKEKGASRASSAVGLPATRPVAASEEPALSRKPAAEFTLQLGRISLSSVDLAVAFFVAVGLLAVVTAGNFGVANREFRVIVIEPALLYGLVRASKLARRDLVRLIDAFILSAVAVSAIGLYQFRFTDWVIVGEGVRRVLSVYGSPNNLALYLDRALPLAVALALFSGDRRRRIGYAAACLPIAAALYLTYSRGAWLIGLPAGLLVIGLFSGRRVRLAVAALVVVGIVLLIPFSQTARFQSLFQEGTGTGFFRVSVWESGVAMIRDHPVFGVGLDNFLYQYPQYIQPDAWREPNLSHPHNILLDFWVRMGIGGVVALGWLLFEFFRRAWPRLADGVDRPLALGLTAGLVAALAHGMIDAAYFYVDLAFVFMLMFAVMAQVSGQPAEEAEGES